MKQIQKKSENISEKKTEEKNFVKERDLPQYMKPF
jgi:hypothetical protein